MCRDILPVAITDQIRPIFDITWAAVELATDAAPDTDGEVPIRPELERPAVVNVPGFWNPIESVLKGNGVRQITNDGSDPDRKSSV